MKYWLLPCCLGIVTLLSGCAQNADDADKTGSGASAETAAPEVEGDKISLTPENTSIEFIGNHTGDDPKPRHGSFQQFAGTAVVDGALKAVTVDIETASLTTEIEDLTKHLKNTDFFDVNQYPQARFESTEIKDNGDGTVEITGDLTLLDSTQSVTFPASVSTESGLTLKAEFEIDRTRWGMDYGLDKIEKQVPMTITIGG
jgi:polyisoprenoid-binding protein YceI